MTRADKQICLRCGNDTSAIVRDGDKCTCPCGNTWRVGSPWRRQIANDIALQLAIKAKRERSAAGVGSEPRPALAKRKPAYRARVDRPRAKELGAQFKAWRMRKGVGATECCNWAGVDDHRLYHWETCRNAISTNDFYRIMHAICEIAKLNKEAALVAMAREDVQMCFEEEEMC